MRDATEIAAQLWTLDRHAKKTMDPELCEDIAAAIEQARAEAFEAAGKVVDDEHELSEDAFKKKYGSLYAGRVLRTLAGGRKGEG